MRAWGRTGFVVLAADLGRSDTVRGTIAGLTALGSVPRTARWIFALAGFGVADAGTGFAGAWGVAHRWYVIALPCIRVARAWTGKTHRRCGADDLGMPATGSGIARIGGASQIVTTALRGIDAISIDAADGVMPGQPVAGIEMRAIGIMITACLVGGNAVVVVGAAAAAGGRPRTTKTGALRATWAEIGFRTTRHPMGSRLADGRATVPCCVETGDFRQAGTTAFFGHAFVGI